MAFDLLRRSYFWTSICFFTLLKWSVMAVCFLLKEVHRQQKQGLALDEEFDCEKRKAGC